MFVVPEDEQLFIAIGADAPSSDCPEHIILDVRREIYQFWFYDPIDLFDEELDYVIGGRDGEFECVWFEWFYI